MRLTKLFLRERFKSIGFVLLKVSMGLVVVVGAEASFRTRWFLFSFSSMRCSTKMSFLI